MKPSNLSKLAECHAAGKLKPIAHTLRRRYPLVECLNKEPCEMRLDCKGKPPLCTAVFQLEKTVKHEVDARV